MNNCIYYKPKTFIFKHVHKTVRIFFFNVKVSVSKSNHYDDENKKKAYQ